MIWYWVAVALSVVASGVIARKYADAANTGGRAGRRVAVSNGEFAAVAAVVLLLVVPVTGIVADRVSVGSQTGGWHQFLNGSVTAAYRTDTACDRDGDCEHTYQCDPEEDGEWVTEYDSKGNPTGRRYVPHTTWHDCPYATVEHTYLVDTSFDRGVVIDRSVFAANPVEWRAGEGMDPSVQTGPSEWWARQDRALDAGHVPAMTKVDDYSNFVLASTATILKRSSGDIARYRKAGMLVPHTVGVPDGDPVTLMTASKFQAIRVPNVDTTAWNDTLNRFNAALGIGVGEAKHGDMHIVAVPADRVDPDKYTRALVAWWQSPAMGKWGLPKNSIVVVFGVDPGGRRVVWSRAKTGMPIGNGSMLQALSNDLTGPFDPTRLLGATNAAIRTDGSVRYFPSREAAIPRIVFFDYPFRRACMEHCDSTETGSGFVRLEADVVPDRGIGGYLLMWLINMVAVAGAWCAALFAFSWRETRPDTPPNRKTPHDRH